MVDPTHVLHLQAVTRTERRPAIPAIKEFEGQSKLQVRVVPQVADLADPEFGCTISPHHQGIGVIETKLSAHADALLAKQRAQGICVQRLLCF